MNRGLLFWVPGTPIPQGSKTVAQHGGRVWLRDANARPLKLWRSAVAASCGDGTPLDGPLRLTLRLYMPRPKRPKYERPAVKPDLDKLVRAVCDGLTQGGAIADDARIVSAQIDEYYASAWQAAGASIKIEEI